MTTAKKTAAAPAKKRTPAAKPASSAEKAVEGPAGDEYEVLRPISIDGEQRAIGDTVKLSPINASELVSHGYVRKA